MAKAPARRTNGQVLAPVTYFASEQPAGVIGLEDFKGHDPATSWDDGGLAQTIVEEDVDALKETIIKHLDQFKASSAHETSLYGAGQAHEAALDYMTRSPMQVAIIQGDLCVTIDGSNDAVEFRPFWRLEDMLLAAIEHADKQQQLPELTDSLGAVLDRVNEAIRPKAPPPQVHVDPQPVEQSPPPQQQQRNRARRNGANSGTKPARRRVATAVN